MSTGDNVLKMHTVDYHTAGEPFRIIVEGAPEVRGATVRERRLWAAANVDDIRRLLVNEPRGHADMYGCFVTPPDDAGADLGVVFFHNSGYSTACGHGTIALVTWALESGHLQGTDGEIRVTVDAPSGRLISWATMLDGDVRAVRFRNVPAFVHTLDLRVGRFLADVAYGGAFYAIIQAQSVGLRVEQQSLPEFIALGRDIKVQLEAAHHFQHPVRTEIEGVYGVMFTDGQRNVTVFANGEVDRSPCGSGTSARLAVLHARGQLMLGEDYVHESIIGTKFTARITELTSGGVITEVEGTAHLTGRHEFVLEARDQLGVGFLLR
jgi:proline racemase